LPKIPLENPLEVKPIKPFSETGQAGFAWAVWKNSTCGKNSNFTSIDLSIRSTDSSETLGIAGVSHGLPLAKIQSPKLTGSRGIESQPPKPPLLELHRKPPN
jgi:hypothetical protein